MNLEGPRRARVPRVHYQGDGRHRWPALLPGVVTLAVLVLSGVLAAVDQPLWGLALVLFGLAAVFTAAARCGWRWDRDRGDDRGKAEVIEHERVDPEKELPPPAT
jgi:hypothetical protein